MDNEGDDSTLLAIKDLVSRGTSVDAVDEEILDDMDTELVESTKELVESTKELVLDTDTDDVSTIDGGVVSLSTKDCELDELKIVKDVVD